MSTATAITKFKLFTDNKIDSEGIEAISCGSGQCVSLRKLILSENNIGRGSVLLKGAFRTNASITELNLSIELNRSAQSQILEQRM